MEGEPGRTGRVSGCAAHNERIPVYYQKVRWAYWWTCALFCLAIADKSFILRLESANERPGIMDVVFNCPKCEQELAVDSAGSGTEINCPSCGALIVIPAPEPTTSRPGAESAAGAPRGEVNPVNPIASSAAAKVEMHLRVPVHKTPTESLIVKPLVPLEVAAKETDKKLRVKTIKHTDCVEVGHDKFDEVVSNFLAKIGEANMMSITTIVYTHLDIGTQKLLQDFGVLIVYRG